MKRNVKMLSILVLIITILSLTGIVNSVFASSHTQPSTASATVDITSTSKLKAGDNIEVTFKITNLTNVGEGIDTILGTLDYESSIFDTVKNTDISTLNGWNIQAFNEETKIFTANKGSKITQGEDIFKVTLKAKAILTVDSTNVGVKEITLSGGQNGVINADAVNVTIEKATGSNPSTPTDPTTPSNPSTPTEPTTPANPSNPSTPSTPSNPTTPTNPSSQAGKTTTTGATTSTTLPKTGETTIGIVFIVIIALVISIILYVRYKKISNK